MEITETHKKLLKRLNICWEHDRYGVGRLTVDERRPYGNSDILGDIASIIGMRKLDHENDEEYNEVEIRTMRMLHSQMPIVLKQIIADACK